MAPSWVLRLPQHEAKASPLLIKVSRKDGGHELDLDLLATDGDAAYTAKVRQRSLKKLRAKNYEGSDDEWNALVSQVLDPAGKTSSSSTQGQNLDVSCSITGKDPAQKLSVVIRNKVEEITQRLGAIELTQTQDTDDVDLFGWTLQVVEERDQARQQISADKEASKSTTETVASLRKELEDLVAAKAEHETQLLNKFVLLLNEKKLKIRNMQRLLSTAQVDEKKLKEVEQSIQKDDTTKSRGKKRSARRAAAAAEESEESEAFETMDVDKETDNDEGEARQRAETPDREEETETEDEEDLDAAPTTRSQAAKGRGRKSLSPIPPPRELPFQKKAAAGKGKARSPPAQDPEEDDEATASEDDEL